LKIQFEKEQENRDWTCTNQLYQAWTIILNFKMKRIHISKLIEMVITFVKKKK